MGSTVLSKTLILEGSHQGVPPKTTATSAPIPVVSHCHSILQGIFPTQELNLVFFVSGFLTIWPPAKPDELIRMGPNPVGLVSL